MPRGRKRKIHWNELISVGVIRTFVSLLLILFALLSLIAFFTPEYSVNSQIVKVLRGLLGLAAILVPIILALSGYILINKTRAKIKEIRILGGITILAITLASFLHSIVSSQDAYEISRKGEGGGLVGYKISTALTNGVSIYGAIAILVILLVISLFLIFNISFDQIAKFIAEHKPSFGTLSFLKKGEKKDSKSGDLDLAINSGYVEEQVEEKKTAEIKDEEEEVTDFEIIPSMAEPQQGGVGSELQMANSLYSVKPDIPKLPSDKIWQYPPLDLLIDPPTEIKDTSDVDNRAKKIKDTLKSFGIEVEISDTKVGSSVTQFALQPKSVTKISKIASLHEDLALALASPTGSVRIEAPIPGKSLIGIEVPNINRSTVYMRPLLTSEGMKGMKSKLGIVLGKDVGGKTYVYDISKMPHILIAGTTGSGKSIFIHNIMLSLLYRANPQEVKFILVDPKRVELSHYQGLPHLITPVVTDMEKAPSVFKWAVAEMDKRYKLFEQAKVSNIDAYNERSGIQAMPYIVLAVDELAEIMVRDPTGVEKSIIRLAQLARATGIHLVLAVQRPSTNVVTGLIKANISCRVAFNVASQIDSRVIIDQPGAEKLLGKGDMLFIPPDANKPTRLQGALVTYKEVDDVVAYLKSQGIEPEYKEDVLNMATDKIQKAGMSDWGSDDDKFDEAVDIVQSIGKASASLLQRKMAIGYARAARIIDEMETKNIIGPAVNGSKARDVLTGGGYLGSSSENLPDDWEEEV